MTADQGGSDVRGERRPELCCKGERRARYIVNM